jgi:hypothetical protein
MVPAFRLFNFLRESDVVFLSAVDMNLPLAVVVSTVLVSILVVADFAGVVELLIVDGFLEGYGRVVR